MTSDTNAHPAISPDHQLPPYIPKRSKVLRIVIWSLLLLVLILVLWLIYRHMRKPRKKRSRQHKFAGISITTATAQKGSIGVYLESIGTVTPVYTVSITSQVTGPIIAVHCYRGSACE